MLADLRWRCLYAVVLLGLPAVVTAASLTITPEQTELLKQLPPAQRELLRKALGEETSAVRSAEVLGAEGEAGLEDVQSALPAFQKEEGSARLRPGDTVLIHFEETEETGARGATEQQSRKETEEAGLTAEERARRREAREAEKKLLAARLPRNPVFVLDQFGAVTMRNVGRFVLAGLNETEAAERIAAERAFAGLRVRVKRLPIEPELKRFGHDLFSGVPRTFAPATDIPVPADYVVGPGDTVVVQMLGKENIEHELTVTRDGAILFPGIGPIGVAGLTFAELQKVLQRRVSRQFIGAQAVVTLGRLRSIRVFVLGDVKRPGSYTVSSLSTLTNALLASGGVTDIGSLRDVQLKRAGRVVSRLDLYDLLLRGDMQGDVRLQPGDAIFVPPVGRVVGIGGRVRRPALYELKNEASVEELIELAAGLMSDADGERARLERIARDRIRTVLDLDLTSDRGRAAKLQDGDIVRIFPVPEQRRRAVRLVGHVLQPGDHEWREGMRLSDVIPSLQTLQADADTRYALVTRERADNRRLEIIGADPAKALAHPGGPSDTVLQPRDEVRVFGVHDDRASLIRPLLERAKRASSPERPWREVRVGGSVHHPGSYPWSPGMTVEDLIHAGGGLTERAYTLEAELTRYAVPEGERRVQVRELIRLDPANSNGMSARLQPHDRLVVRHVPRWEEEGAVEILGEVRFPGRYPIARGERLSQVIERAGGLTGAAYPRAAIFLRESVRQREQDYLQQLVTQLERDLVLVKSEGAEIGVRKETALLEGEALLRQMRAAKATGRMVVDLSAVLDVNEGYDVVMQAGDRLVIPTRPDEVTVIGEVYYPTSHVYVAKRDREEYLRLSGGITERGNKRAAYIVHADGSVSPPRRWFENEPVVGPGDTIIVPIKVDRIGNLKLFTDISTILFQLAVTAAALDTIGVFD